MKRFSHIGFGIAAFVIVLLVALWSYEYYRILPEDVMLGEIPLTGLTREDANAIVELEVHRFEKQTFSVAAGELGVYHFQPHELGIEYDAKGTLNKIFRSTSWYGRMLASAFDGQESQSVRQFKPVVYIQKEYLHQTIGNFLSSFEEDAKNAKVVLVEGVWQIEQEQPGRVLKENEVEKIAKQVMDSTYPYHEQLSFIAEYSPVQPDWGSTHVQPLYERMIELTSKPLSIHYDQETIELSFNEHPEWFVVNDDYTDFHLNKESIEKFIAQLAEQYDEPAGEVIITNTEDYQSEYDTETLKKAIYEGDFTKGRKMNQLGLMENIEKRIEEGKPAEDIEISYETIYPTINSLVPDLYFPQILSTGISSYRLGNHPNRVKNIELSLGTFKGIIVEPGQEVSFNRITGWITPRKGYTKTQIISAGKVEEGVGGGVCQSSTTVYRAVLNAGFPVTERRNHTLDVSYYHAFGYGLDATVYTDARSDLRFVNDFPGPVLINSYLDHSRLEAHVEFYGTTDERTVELTNIPTGNYLLKKWEQKIKWPDREDIRYVISKYQVPKEEEEENPLEG